MDEERPAPFLAGRRAIYTRYGRVDASNVVEVLRESLASHALNAREESYLRDYMSGLQPILGRRKDVRPEICNRVVENRATEIVSFKVGYQLAEPVQYVCSLGDDGGGAPDGDERSKRVRELNRMMFSEDKACSDLELFEWMCVCGVGYRLVLPDVAPDADEGGAPFEMCVLDPRSTFVVRGMSYDRRPLMGVIAGVDEDGGAVYEAYTDSAYYRVASDRVVEEAPNPLGMVPVVEYRLNSSMLGVFETVLPLLDAINAIDSNRLDGIEQTVQSLMKFVNCDIDEATFVRMLKLGAVKVKTVDGQLGDVQFLTNDLDQTQTQVAKEDLLRSVYAITGMPGNLNGGASTSDTGTAVLLRDGWSLAESHAKGYELSFKRAERDTLRLVLRICRMAGADVGLRLRDIDMAFNRRNYENALVKSQVLTGLLGCGKVHPQLAFQASGLFCDPESAYLQSQEWSAEQDAASAAKESSQDGPEAVEGDGERSDPREQSVAV